MEIHGVVPDVIDDVPPHTLKVVYKGEVEVNSGNVLTPTQVVSPPIHLSWPVEEGSLYTLCLTDPDAPSRQEPTLREVHHWLVVNIPDGDVTKGETLTEFVGSGPPKGSGLHRYVYLVYRQPGRLTCDEPHIPNNTAEGRRNFSIRKFADKYSLSLTAGNLYQAGYDPTTDIVHRQLGISR